MENNALEAFKVVGQGWQKKLNRYYRKEEHTRIRILTAVLDDILMNLCETVFFVPQS